MCAGVRGAGGGGGAFQSCGDLIHGVACGVSVFW